MPLTNIIISMFPCHDCLCQDSCNGKLFGAFHRHDQAKAVDILIKDLKVFAAFNAGIFRELTQLLPLENFRY